MRILAATYNPHKLREFQRLFPQATVLSPQEYGISFTCVEDGENFYQNAMKKALCCAESCAKSGGNSYSNQIPETLPILADDSGICVPALNNRPGIYSARFGADTATPPRNDAERTKLLLTTMDGVQNRSAYYVCALILYWRTTHMYIATEEWHGTIAHSVSTASGGFGYDPIFYIPELGCCASELTDKQKDTYSHRGKAARALWQAAQGSLH